jgi:hypothetical protein
LALPAVQSQGAVLAMLMLPDIEAGAILADPPVVFRTWSCKGEGRSPQRHYACLSFEQLAAHPVASAAAAQWISLRSVCLVEDVLPGSSRTAEELPGSWAAATARDIT